MTNTQYTKKRTLFKEIIDHAEHKNALVVTGMRQVGKTTLLRQVFDSLAGKRKVWFDLDNPLDQKIFEDIEYKNIYERLQKMAGISGKDDRMYVFIDEIQNFPEYHQSYKISNRSFRREIFYHWNLQIFI